MLSQIGEKIREFRLRDGRTQQEMAKALGITPQAISRWESGLSYPDVEMFPKIAEYFGVSIDRLYGRAIDERELEVERILGNIREMHRNGVDPKDIVDVLRDAVRQYPKEERFMLSLCNVLHRLSLRDKESDSAAALRYAIESATWGEKILAETADNTFRYEAAHTLKYIYTENPEMGFKIDRLAETMPPIKICRENILCYVTDEEEAFRNAQWFSMECLTNIVYFSDWYKDPEERFRHKKTVLSMVKAYLPDGDYENHWSFQKILTLYMECARGELDFGTPDAALELLEEVLRILESFPNGTEAFVMEHTSRTLHSLPSQKIYPNNLLAHVRTILGCMEENSPNFPKIVGYKRYIDFRERFDELCATQA